MGSPPQMETIGAPHSSAALRHCCTVNFSLIVSAYSRMRPQPVHVRLQACSGSSIITSGNLSTPRNRFPAMYFDMLTVMLKGNLTTPPSLEPARYRAWAARLEPECYRTGAARIFENNEPKRTLENNVDISGTSDKTPSENRCR